MKLLMPLMACAFFCHCHKTPKVIEVRNDGGFVIERYTVFSGSEDDKKHLLYEKFDDSGNLKESIEYKNGKMNGLRKLYDSGKLYSIETRKDDKFDGPYTSFYPNGKKRMEGQYRQDVLTGEVRVYYPSGALKEIVTFRDNQEDGPFTEYYENGHIKAIGHYIYRDGPLEEGPLQLFDSTGTLIRKMDCKAGICQTTWKLDDSKRW